MAIIKCPECQNEVSDKASSCPKCGCPIKEDVKFTEKAYRDKQSVIDGKNYAKGQYMFELPYKIGCLIFFIILFIIILVIAHR